MENISKRLMETSAFLFLPLFLFSFSHLMSMEQYLFGYKNQDMHSSDDLTFIEIGRDKINSSCMSGPVVSTYTFLEDGVRVMFMTYHGCIWVYNAEEKESRKTNLSVETIERSAANALVLSPDGMHYALQLGEYYTGKRYKKNVIMLKRLGSDTIVQEFVIDDAKLIKFSPDGKYLVAANDDRICVWGIATGTRILRIDCTKKIRDISLSNEAEYIAIANEHICEIWEKANKKTVRTINVKNSKSIALSGDGAYLGIADNHDEVREKTMFHRLMSGTIDEINIYDRTQGDNKLFIFNVKTGNIEHSLDCSIDALTCRPRVRKAVADMRIFEVESEQLPLIKPIKTFPFRRKIRDADAEVDEVKLEDMEDDYIRSPLLPKEKKRFNVHLVKNIKREGVRATLTSLFCDYNDDEGRDLLHKKKKIIKTE